MKQTYEILFFARLINLLPAEKNNTQLNRKNVIINCKKYYVQR